MKILSFVSRTKDKAPVAAPARLDPDYDQTDLQQKIVDWLSQQLGIPASEIDPNAHMSDLGLDSLLATELSAFVEEITGIATADEVAWQFPTVAQLADYIVQTRNETW